MRELSDSQFLELAVEHEMLAEKDIESLLTELTGQSVSLQQGLLLKGHLSGPQIEIIKSLANPNEVVPGYRVEKVLGRGGFGVVFRASQLNMERDVALKTIALARIEGTASTKRFEQEAKIVGQLRHPNIVSAYDFGMHEDRLFLAMELVDGVDLDQVLDEFALTEYGTWQILRQVVTALAYAAEKGITHRDIKPGNLMITDAPLGYPVPAGVPMVKVTDFGLACFAHDRPQHQKLTVANAGLGTPLYVAPEQLTGSEVDSRADMYSIGATAFHMLTGKPPHSELEISEIVSRKISNSNDWTFELPNDWSPQCKALVRRLSAWDREDRFSTHEELLIEIDRAIPQMNRNRSSSLDGTTPEASQQATTDPKGSLGSSQDFVVASNAQRIFEQTGLDLRQTVQLNDLTSLHDENRFRNGEHKQESHVEKSPNHGEGNQLMPPVKSALAEKKTSTLDFGGRASRSRIWFVGAVALVLVGLLLTWALLPIFGSSGAEVRLTVPAGATHYLFDGQNVGRPIAGKWDVHKGDRGRVLAGRGKMRFKCEDQAGNSLDHFRFAIGLVLNEASEVAIIFEHESRSSDKELLVRADETGISFGSKTAGVYSSLGDLAPWPKEDEDSFGFPKILVERHVNYWDVYCEGQSLGRYHDESSGPFAFVVDAQDGTAYLADINIRELAKPEPTDE